MNPLDIAAKNGHYESCRVMANWPSVLKSLRVNEVRSKWSIFLQNTEASLSYSEPIKAILQNEETRVVAQKAQLKANKGKVRFHSFDNKPRKKMRKYVKCRSRPGGSAGEPTYNVPLSPGPDPGFG